MILLLLLIHFPSGSSLLDRPLFAGFFRDLTSSSSSDPALGQKKSSLVFVVGLATWFRFSTDLSFPPRNPASSSLPDHRPFDSFGSLILVVSSYRGFSTVRLARPFVSASGRYAILSP